MVLPERTPKLLKILLFSQRWFIAIRRRSGITPGYRNINGYTLLRAPRDRFYADPFLFKKGDINYLFFEDFRFKHSKGVISCRMLNRYGESLSEAVVLEKTYHLSYPLVFEWSDEIWMLPDTSENGTIELYRSKRFPWEWKCEKVLMKDVTARDTTIMFHGDRFWLFTNMDKMGGSPPGKGRWDNLFLFYSDSPLGKWIPHTHNPVITDISRARPAGKIFEEAGDLIRPGQDCSIRYGAAIQFSKIELLNEREYRENPCWCLTPVWLGNGVGTHTYNSNEDFEVLDGYTFGVNLYSKWLTLTGIGKRLL